MPWWAQLLGGMGTVIVAVFGSWMVRKGNRETAVIETRAAPYDALAARISKLEEQVGTLRHQVEALEDEQRSDRRWIRCAIRLMRRWVPPEHHLEPPPWFDR